MPTCSIMCFCKSMFSHKFLTHVDMTFVTQYQVKNTILELKKPDILYFKFSISANKEKYQDVTEDTEDYGRRLCHILLFSLFSK